MPLSQIVSDSIQDGAVAPVDLSSVAQYTGFKNRLINGAMVIDQRRAGTVVTPTNAQYTLDRWGAYAFGSATGKFTVQQNAGSVTPPAGFTNYLGVTSTSAYSVAAGDITSIYQVIEGYNIADLAWGTASAATITISFWVRSSLTGTFSACLESPPANRSYAFTYTINAANTWEQKSVTIAGDTSGSWNTTNGQGLFLVFSLGTGSTYSTAAGSWTAGVYYAATGATSVVGTNGATFYITGVQLEKGSTATSFDYRPYGTELALCQRYYQQINGNSGNPYVGSGWLASATTYSMYLPTTVTMRSAPTFGQSGAGITDGVSFGVAISTVTNLQSTTNAIRIEGATATAGTSGRPSFVYISSSNYVYYSSEL